MLTCKSWSSSNKDIIHENHAFLHFPRRSANNTEAVIANPTAQNRHVIPKVSEG